MRRGIVRGAVDGNDIEGQAEALAGELLEAFNAARQVDSDVDFWSIVAPILDAHQAAGGDLLDEAMARFEQGLRERGVES